MKSTLDGATAVLRGFASWFSGHADVNTPRCSRGSNTCIGVRTENPACAIISTISANLQSLATVGRRA